ncbi:MAG: PorV/PorQ family protein [Candidatus Margulisiibacteriota bacterium]
MLEVPCWAQTAFDPAGLAIGARSLGMGGTGAALAEGAETIFNNPAGLGEIDQFNFSSQAGNVLDDVTFTQLAGLYPLGQQGALGLGFAGAYVSGIELRDTAGTLQGKANYGDALLVGSYGKKLLPELAFGLNLKYYALDGTENNNGDGHGWNLDVGLLQHGLDWLSLGLVAENILSSNRVAYQNGASEPLPQVVKAGGRMQLFGDSFNSAVPAPVNLAVLADLNFALQTSQPLSTHLGAELAPNQALTLRGGFDGEEMTAGLSLNFAGLACHFAYTRLAKYLSLSFNERGWPPEGPAETFLARR